MVSKYDLRRYYKQVRRQLICSGKEKQKTIAYLQEGIADYLDANPQADMAQLQVQFGTPEYIAACSIKAMDTEGLSGKLHARKRICSWVAAAILAALLLLGISLVFSMVAYYVSIGGYNIILNS